MLCVHVCASHSCSEVQCKARQDPRALCSAQARNSVCSKSVMQEALTTRPPVHQPEFRIDGVVPYGPKAPPPGHPLIMQDWEWGFVVDESTDRKGWEYARCFWLGPTHNQLGVHDFVKRRKWCVWGGCGAWVDACHNAGSWWADWLPLRTCISVLG